jgi:hypothetical protein
VWWHTLASTGYWATILCQLMLHLRLMIDLRRSLPGGSILTSSGAINLVVLSVERYSCGEVVVVVWRDALDCVVGREEFLSTRSRCSVVVSQSCEQDKCARVK